MDIKKIVKFFIEIEILFFGLEDNILIWRLLKFYKGLYVFYYVDMKWNEN